MGSKTILSQLFVCVKGDLKFLNDIKLILNDEGCPSVRIIQNLQMSPSPDNLERTVFLEVRYMLAAKTCPRLVQLAL